MRFTSLILAVELCAALPLGDEEFHHTQLLQTKLDHSKVNSHAHDEQVLMQVSTQAVVTKVQKNQAVQWRSYRTQRPGGRGGRKGGRKGGRRNGGMPNMPGGGMAGGMADGAMSGGMGGGMPGPMDGMSGMSGPGMAGGGMPGPMDGMSGMSGPGMAGGGMPGPMDGMSGMSGPGMAAGGMPGPMDDMSGMSGPGMAAGGMPGPMGGGEMGPMASCAAECSDHSNVCNLPGFGKKANLQDCGEDEAFLLCFEDCAHPPECEGEKACKEHYPGQVVECMDCGANCFGQHCIDDTTGEITCDLETIEQNEDFMKCHKDCMDEMTFGDDLTLDLVHRKSGDEVVLQQTRTNILNKK